MQFVQAAAKKLQEMMSRRVHCFVESAVSITKTRLLTLLQVKLKEEYCDIMMVRILKSIPLIDWLTTGDNYN